MKNPDQLRNITTQHRVPLLGHFATASRHGHAGPRFSCRAAKPWHLRVKPQPDFSPQNAVPQGSSAPGSKAGHLQGTLHHIRKRWREVLHPLGRNDACMDVRQADPEFPTPSPPEGRQSSAHLAVFPSQPNPILPKLSKTQWY